MYRVWPYDVVDEWVWLYRLGRKALPALHRFDAIFHVFWWAKETAMVVYKYDYIFVLLERARNECHYSTINHSQLLEELLPYGLIFHHAQRQDCAEICHPLVGYVFMGRSNELSRSSTGKEGDTIGRCCEYMHVDVCTSCTSDCYFGLPTSPDDAVVSGN